MDRKERNKILMDLKYDHLTRQLDLIPPNVLGMKINIIGCGAIGSFAALALAKMGLTRIEVWDFDEVSIENMSNQFFRFADIGKNKAVALHDLVKDFTGVAIKHTAGKFEAKDTAGMEGIIIVAVDSMAARDMIYKSLKANYNMVKFLIDPRMSAEKYAQYTVNMADNEWYSKCLYSDQEAVAERCTAKSTIYTVTSSTGLISKTVKNLLLGQAYPETIQWDISKSNKDSISMFETTVK